MRMVSSDFLQYGAHFRTFSAKTNDRILKYNQKGPFVGHFGHFLPNLGQTRIFPKNRALSLLHVYYPLTSCKISEKTNEPIPGKLCHARTHARTHEGTDRPEFIGHLRKAGVQKICITNVTDCTEMNKF